jgi:phage gp45-like
MPDLSQRARAIGRAVKLVMASFVARLDSMIEVSSLTGYSDAAGSIGTATTADDDAPQVIEQYGVATRPPGPATGIVVAPGGDGENRFVIGSSAPAGRPATAAGDAILWTAAGHSITLEDGGAISIASKDGSSIVLDSAGSISVNVGAGAHVDIGGAGAVVLALGQATIDAVDAMLAAGVAVPGDGGASLKATMITGWLGVKASILATRARGV